MRDYFVTAVILGSLPFILWRPWIGIIMWCWLSYMNPHKQTWAFAYNMPFALLVAVCTLVGLLVLREPKRIPWTRETILLLVFVLWMLMTTFFSFYPAGAWLQFDKVWRVQLMTFVTLMLITSEVRLKAMVWMIALSLAYYGTKGGVFTITTGGAHRVWGPSDTFIGGNNEIALALIMTIPLLRFLQLDAKRIWLRWALGISMVLCAIAAIGSQSRGAFLAIIAMSGFLWLKSRHKIAMGILGLCAVIAVLLIMPQEYYDRLTTIENYQQDASSRGRINAWWVAWNVAKDRPLVGGGFEMFQPWVFLTYAPVPDDVHDVHSIYFEILGEHGFVAFGMFLLLWWFTWRTASEIRRVVSGDANRRWLGDLSGMVQVSMVGYLTGGAFLGLAYWDLPYHLVAIMVIAKGLVDKHETLPIAASEAVSGGALRATVRASR